MRSSSVARLTSRRPSAISVSSSWRVVDDLVVAAELRVLVEQRVEAVRALRDDLAHAHAVEHLDVRHRQHLEQVLVARAAGRVAGAHLRRAEHGDGDAGPAQQVGHRLGDALVLVVEAAGAADPVQVLGLQRLAGIDDLHVVEALGPVAALALVHAPRVALVLHAAVGVAELAREVRLHQRQVAPHVEDLVEDLDVDRADLVARLAARARPDLLGRDALEQRVGADRDLRVGAERRRHDGAAGGGHHLAGLEHDLAWVERLAGGVGRAHARAAAAHRAGVGVEQLLPREVLDDRGAERLQLGLGEVRHRLHRALRAASCP